MAQDFAQVATFARLSAAARTALRQAATLQGVKGGDYLVHEGEPADTLYLVATGRFYVQRTGGPVIAEIEAGEPIGELAFFSGGTRTADVRAMRDSTVFALSRSAYEQVSAAHRDIADGILADVARRLARTTRALGEGGAMAAKPGRVIAMLPAAGTALPPGLVERLASALARHDRTRLVREHEIPHGMDLENQAFGNWIADLEASADRIIMCAGHHDGWNRAIARNADDLLLTAPLHPKGGAPADDIIACSALEDHAIGLFLPENRALILWRADSRQPIAGAARWLARRPVKLHHHLALDDEAGVQRIARFMAGRANGVVLAGGGAQGCAHLGVMQALVENDIPIDFYGGASAGAAMGAALASGLSAEDTLGQMHEMFVTNRAMKRMTVPVHSFLDPRVFDAQLRARYGEKDLADLPFNFLAVSTNLSTNQVHVHRRGPVWEAVRASGALPAILPPFITAEGDVLVDGGLLDNLPVEVMRAAKAGPNVVVALAPDPGAPWRIAARNSDVRTPGQLARDLLLRRKPDIPFPSLIEIMSRSMIVASEAAVEHALAQADALLIPPLPQGMQLLDWHLGREAAEAAHRFTTHAVATRADLAAMKAPAS
ncbi:MAG: patatin-like phospholipase family protein [Polymorphobacter sp.]|uniref:patatin-like phospholipase family protein n=1 Tax=Polymorphobacter sp. TaxID=1909290 RepID=UPI003A85DC09